MDNSVIGVFQREIMSGSMPDFAKYQALMDVQSPLFVAMAKNRHDDTALHVATRSGNLQVVKYIHESLGVELNHVNADGKTALHEAAQQGHFECAKYLLEAGACIDSLKKADWTPLMLSCTKDNIPIVDLLLNHNASLTLRNKDGWTPFHIASREGDPRVLTLFLSTLPTCWETRSNNGRTPLHTVALYGRTEALELMHVRCGYDINVSDSCGVTPLMDAVRGDHLETVKFLLKFGADNGVKDTLGREALHHGAQAGSETVLRYLLENVSIDVNKPTDVSMTTPLHYAAKEGQASVIKLLLDYGADRNVADKHGRTAIQIARNARSGSKAAVLALTEFIS